MKPEEPSKSLPRVWIILFTAILAIALILIFLSQADRAPSPAVAKPFVDDASARTVTFMDGGRPILTYRYGDQLPAGLDAKQTRSCYIHPLYSLDGEPLTADFPDDHLHHHGLFWAWPVVEVRGARSSNWEPAEPSLRQHFLKWVRRASDGRGARLVLENVWRLGESENVVREKVELTVHSASSLGRAIDIKIVLRPVGGPIMLRGAPADNKGYGGLCFRGAPLFKGAAMTTDAGPLAADSTGEPFRWADISTEDRGVAVFVSPNHPGYPIPWLIRNSYAGVLNPCWPGLAGATLAADVPVALRYRVYIHSGDAKAGRVKEAYEAYIAGPAR
jgi:hypothetical protein